ncbi:MAG: hypothetical protein DRJ68_05440, partial [Thermoprotei archaeon]
MRRGGYLTRPVLRFKGGTALTPLEGFKLGLKPFRGERRVRVYVFSRASTAKSSLEMVENLANGVKGYGGMSSWFNCDLEGEGVVKVQSNEDYVKAAEEVGDVDLVLAFIPDEMSVEYDEDPYMPLKRVLASRGMPSQMIEESTCRYMRANSYVLFNLALSIYSKAGGIPWVLDERTYFDCTIGFDSGGGGVVVTSTFSNPFSFTWTMGSQTVEGLAEAIASSVKPSWGVKTMAIHKDGPIMDWELEAVRRAISKLDRRGIVKDAKWSLFEVKSRFTPRILGASGLNLYNPEKGVY